MKTKSNIIISFLAGILFIFLIIWNRFLRVRLPKELLPSDNNNVIYLILCISIIFLCITIVYFLYLIKYLPKENSKLMFNIENIIQYLYQYKWFAFIFKVITDDVPNGPLTVYTYIYKYVYIKSYAEKIGIKLHNIFFDNNKRIILLYIILFIIPRLIVACIFVIEIVCFKQLIYLYKILPRLILPVLSKMILFIVQHHAKSCLDYYFIFFKLYYDENKVFHIHFKKLLDSEDIKEQEYLVKNPDNLQENWDFYQLLYNITYQILEYKVKKYKYYINTVYYGLFFMGFLFYFLILINLW